MQPDPAGTEAVFLARDARCHAQYSAAGDAVRVRVGTAHVSLSTAEFLSVCATLLKAARALGRRPYIPGLAAPDRDESAGRR